MQLEIGKRFKKYENAFGGQLPPRMPVIIRVDGRAFHTLTKREKAIEKPFCPLFNSAMDEAAFALCDETHAIMAYSQSDEISLLLLNDRRHETQPWFNNEEYKMASITASIASVAFSQYMTEKLDKQVVAHFDSRAFVIPQNEIENYFIWRQLDAIRNAKNGWTEYTLGEEVGRGTARKQLHGMPSSKKVEYVEEVVGCDFYDETPSHFIYGTEVRATDEGYVASSAPYYIDAKEHIQGMLNRYYEDE